MRPLLYIRLSCTALVATVLQKTGPQPSETSPLQVKRLLPLYCVWPNCNYYHRCPQAAIYICIHALHHHQSCTIWDIHNPSMGYLYWGRTRAVMWPDRQGNRFSRIHWVVGRGYWTLPRAVQNSSTERRCSVRITSSHDSPASRRPRVLVPPRIGRLFVGLRSGRVHPTHGN